METVENREKFFERLRYVMAPSEVMFIEVAYALAKYGHRAQMRKECDANGNPVRYFEHLRGTALILMDEGKVYDRSLIITALMHDSLEDTKDISPEMLEHLFGPTVATNVMQLTKHADEEKPTYFTRLLQVGSWQAFLVKGCDRLHNLRSLGNLSVEFQRRQYNDTVNYVLPMLYLGVTLAPVTYQNAFKSIIRAVEVELHLLGRKIVG